MEVVITKINVDVFLFLADSEVGTLDQSHRILSSDSNQAPASEHPSSLDDCVDVDLEGHDSTDKRISIAESSNDSNPVTMEEEARLYFEQKFRLTNTSSLILVVQNKEGHHQTNFIPISSTQYHTVQVPSPKKAAEASFLGMQIYFMHKIILYLNHY